MSGSQRERQKGMESELKEALRGQVMQRCNYEPLCQLSSPILGLHEAQRHAPWLPWSAINAGGFDRRQRTDNSHTQLPVVWSCREYLFPPADTTLDDGKLVIKTLEPQYMISEGWVPLLSPSCPKTGSLGVNQTR